MLPNSSGTRKLPSMQSRATQAATDVLFLPVLDCTDLGYAQDYTPCKAVTLKFFFHRARKVLAKLETS